MPIFIRNGIANLLKKKIKDIDLQYLDQNTAKTQTERKKKRMKVRDSRERKKREKSEDER